MKTTTPNILAILGSARSDGDTAVLLRAVTAPLCGVDVIDLNDLRIGPYSYDGAHDDDDFLALAKKMEAADALIFASPVYWYSMSAQMKTVFDRMTDLTGKYKSIGKSLAGKPIFAVAAGGSPAAPESYVQPFADTAAYFDMYWGGLFYAPGARMLTPETTIAAEAFAGRIASSLTSLS